MLVLPCCLRVIERRGIARELEFLHHRVRPALFALHQKGHVNFELNQLGRLVFVATGHAFIQRLETVARFCVLFLFEWNLREVVLRIAKFRIQLRRLFESGLGIVEFFLLHQNFASQIQGRGLIGIRLVRFVYQFQRRGKIALPKRLLRLLEF